MPSYKMPWAEDGIIVTKPKVIALLIFVLLVVIVVMIGTWAGTAKEAELTTANASLRTRLRQMQQRQATFARGAVADSIGHVTEGTRPYGGSGWGAGQTLGDGVKTGNMRAHMNSGDAEIAANVRRSLGNDDYQLNQILNPSLI